MLHLGYQQEHQSGDTQRQLFAAAAYSNFLSARPCLSFDNLAPLLVVQLPEFELRVSEDRALDVGLLEGQQPLVFADRAR